MVLGAGGGCGKVGGRGLGGGQLVHDDGAFLTKGSKLLKEGSVVFLRVGGGIMCLKHDKCIHEIMQFENLFCVQ